MNLAQAISIYAFGTSEGAVRGWDTRGRGRHAAPKVQRKFVTKYGHVAGYFKPGAIAAKIYEDLAAHPGEWQTRKEMRDKYQVGGLLQALQQVERAGIEKGKWRIEYADNNSKVRLVPTDGKRALAVPKPSGNESPEEMKLFNLKIVDRKRLGGGGITKPEKATLEDGTIAVLKFPFKGNAFGSQPRSNIPKGADAEREAAAWQVAKLVGMQDMVMPTVMREVDGETASLQAFAKGTPAADGPNPYDGKADRVRAAAFDYVIGNEDRHQYNWLMDNGKMRLIDHGLAFPDRNYKANFNAKIIRKVAVDDALDDNKYSPKAMAGPYVENREKIDAVLKNLGIPKGPRDGVQARIASLAKADEWQKLPEVKDANIYKGKRLWDESR